MKELTRNTAAINLISAALIVVMLLLNCVGYITTDAGERSIIGYIYMPGERGDLTSYCEERIDGFDVNDAVGTPLWVLCIGVVLLAALIWKRDNALLSIGTLAWSGIGLLGYISSAFLKLGGMYWLHILVLCAAVLVSLAGVLGIKDSLMRE